MSPKRNGKAKATAPVAGTTGADGDGDGDEPAWTAADAKQLSVEERKRPPFSKDNIRAAINRMAAPNRLPATFGSDDCQDAWDTWHAQTPMSLEEIPASERAKAEMPMKCRPPGTVLIFLCMVSSCEHVCSSGAL